MPQRKRSSNGKQRIEIKKIESDEARQVCFSKRKAGIFSKANEMATLCGAKVAVLIQSPAGCPFTFGSPSVNHVIRRFLNGGVGVNEIGMYEAQQLSKIQELNNKVMEASSKYEEALKRKKLLVKRISELCEANEDVRRVENVKDLNLDELRKMVESLDRIKKTARAKVLNDTAAESGHPILTNLNLSGFGTGQWSANSFPTHVNSTNEGPSHLKAMDINLNLFEGGSLGHFGQLNPIINPNATNVGPNEPRHVPFQQTAMDINLNLFEGGSLGHFGQLNPTINPNATNVGPNEPRHVPLQTTAMDINLNLFEGGSLGHFGQLNPIINPNATNVESNEPRHSPLQKAVFGHGLVELDLLGGRVNFAAGKEPK